MSLLNLTWPSVENFYKILQASVAEKQLVMARSLLRRRGHLLVMYFFFSFSLEGTRLGVAKAARSPPSLPFRGRRYCKLILCELWFLKILFYEGFYFFHCHSQFLPTLLVIAMEWKDFSAKPKCEPATSHSCGVVEAIFSQVDRHTTFAITTFLHLPILATCARVLSLQAM